MNILAIILNYKTPEMTLKSADSAVLALNHVTDDWRLTIVDNDSQDGSYNLIKQAISDKSETYWEKVDVVESGHNGGFGAGNNFAIRPALELDPPPEYIYILNSDAFPDLNAVKHLVEHLDKNPKTGIAGSFIHGTDDVPHVTAFRFPTILSELESGICLGIVSKVLKNYIVPMGIPEETQKVDWLAGASMMFRSAMLKQVGLFDERFFLYFEETDLCKQASRKGWDTVYVKESKVAHIGSASTGMREWQRIPRYWLDSRKYYYCKNHGRAYNHLAIIARLLGGLFWQIRRRIQGKPDHSPPHFLGDLLKHWLRH